MVAAAAVGLSHLHTWVRTSAAEAVAAPVVVGPPRCLHKRMWDPPSKLARLAIGKCMAAKREVPSAVSVMAVAGAAAKGAVLVVTSIIVTVEAVEAVAGASARAVALTS